MTAASERLWVWLLCAAAAKATTKMRTIESAIHTLDRLPLLGGWLSSSECWLVPSNVGLPPPDDGVGWCFASHPDHRSAWVVVTVIQRPFESSISNTPGSRWVQPRRCDSWIKSA